MMLLTPPLPTQVPPTITPSLMIKPQILGSQGLTNDSWEEAMTCCGAWACPFIAVSFTVPTDKTGVPCLQATRGEPSPVNETQPCPRRASRWAEQGHSFKDLRGW